MIFLNGTQVKLNNFEKSITKEQMDKKWLEENDDNFIYQDEIEKVNHIKDADKKFFGFFLSKGLNQYCFHKENKYHDKFVGHYLDYGARVFVSVYNCTLDNLYDANKFIETYMKLDYYWKNKDYISYAKTLHKRFYHYVLEIFYEMYKKKEIDVYLFWELFTYFWTDAEFLAQTLDKNLITSIFKLNPYLEVQIEVLKEKLKTEKLTIYRGEESKSSKYYEKGFSWTLNKDTAFWFANRFRSKKGRVIECEIEYDMVLAYFDLGEEEIVFSYSKYRRMVSIEKMKAA